MSLLEELEKKAYSLVLSYKGQCMSVRSTLLIMLCRYSISLFHSLGHRERRVSIFPLVSFNICVSLIFLLYKCCCHVWCVSVRVIVSFWDSRLRVLKSFSMSSQCLWLELPLT